MFFSILSLPVNEYAQERAAEKQQSTRITFKLKNGSLQALITDISGQIKPLTLSSLVSVGTEFVSGKKLSDFTMTRTTPIHVIAENNEKGKLITYLIDNRGEKKRFIINNIFSALADSLINYQPSNFFSRIPSGKYFDIYFERNNGGDLELTIVHLDGRKEPLDLDNLIAATAELNRKCSFDPSDDRTIYITAEENPILEPSSIYKKVEKSEGLTIVQTDAFGIKEKFNFDNIMTAASETLLNCRGSYLRVNTKAPQSSYLKIKLQNDPENNFTPVLYDVEGNKLKLNLSNLISASTKLVPCEQSINQDYLTVVFEKDDKGNAISSLIDQQGNKKSLDILSDLTRASAYLPFEQGTPCSKE
jgi:hypothetical protein